MQIRRNYLCTEKIKKRYRIFFYDIIYFYKLIMYCLYERSLIFYERINKKYKINSFHTRFSFNKNEC